VEESREGPGGSLHRLLIIITTSSIINSNRTGIREEHREGITTPTAEEVEEGAIGAAATGDRSHQSVV